MLRYTLQVPVSAQPLKPLRVSIIMQHTTVLSHPVSGLRPSSVITIREDHIEN